jgi:hypothetical protein
LAPSPDPAPEVESAEPADRPRNYAAQQAPRCEHVRLNGQRCAAPALRARTLCYFHHRALNPDTYDERWLPFIEDANSLQIALARVQRLLLMDGFELARANALLYSLQLSLMNLKNLSAEREQPEGADAGQLQIVNDKGEMGMARPSPNPSGALGIR